MKEKELNSRNFDEFITMSDYPVLIDFYAPWCGPCIRMRPIIIKIAEEYSNELRVGVVNIDTELELTDKYSVMSVPTLIVFKDGQVTAKGVGARNEEQIMQLINEGN